MQRDTCETSLARLSCPVCLSRASSAWTKSVWCFALDGDWKSSLSTQFWSIQTSSSSRQKFTKYAYKWSVNKRKEAKRIAKQAISFVISCSLCLHSANYNPHPIRLLSAKLENPWPFPNTWLFFFLANMNNCFSSLGTIDIGRQAAYAMEMQCYSKLTMEDIGFTLVIDVRRRTARLTLFELYNTATATRRGKKNIHARFTLSWLKY